MLLSFSSGAGAVLYDADTDATLWQGHRFVGRRATNNVAEYEGLLLGLEAVACHFANRSTTDIQNSAARGIGLH